MGFAHFCDVNTLTMAHSVLTKFLLLNVELQRDVCDWLSGARMRQLCAALAVSTLSKRKPRFRNLPKFGQD